MVSISRSDKSLSLVAPKLAARIESGEAAARSVLSRLQADEITDELGFFGPSAPSAGDRRFEVGYDEGANLVAARVGDGDFRSFHPHAVRQMAERLGIPGAFARSQMDGEKWQRAGIADTISNFLSHVTNRDRFLVRSVGSEVRGVLSDSYRRLSSPQIAAGFSEAIEAAGVVPFDARIDDLKWTVRAILPVPMEFRTSQHGTEYVGVGLRISNSDFGAGALDLQTEILRMVCVNGMVGERVLHAIHLGARLPENLRFSEETYRADTAVQVRAMREAIPQLLSPERVQETLAPVAEAMETEVDAAEEIKTLVKAKRISIAQGQEVERLVMNRDGSIVPQGAVTKWTIAQAVSALADNDDATIDSAHELRSEARRVVLN